MNEKYKIKLGKEKTIEALVKAGKYTWSSDNISKFPFEKTEAKEIELVHFNKSISSEDAIKEMDGMGLRPATTTELLLLGAQHPELQRKEVVVALGTVLPFHVHRYVAYLFGLSTLRRLVVTWFVNDWGEIYAFAAVRKSPLETGKLGSVEALDPLDNETFELSIAGKVYEGTLKLKK